MINEDLKFDCPKYPIVPGESVLDRIVRLLADESCDYVYKDIYNLCETSLESPGARQSLADHIAQVYSLNVFATGTVPKEHDGGEMVSGCEYRRRATARQVEFEANKWEKLGYATTIKESKA